MRIRNSEIGIQNGRRRGAVFVTALWIILALTAMVLVLAQGMRVEAMAAANRVSEAQARAIERGAEQTLLTLVDQEVSTPGVTDTISLEERPLGTGYFWVIKPDPDDQTARDFGLTDEAGKLDLNTANSAMLLKLPNMTQDVVDSITMWRGGAATGTGAGDSYYSSLAPPYHLKASPFDSVDELMLVKGMTTDLLYAYDRNHDGMVDNQETQGGGLGAGFNMADGAGRGIAPYVTVYGLRAGKAATTTGVVDVNSPNLAPLQNLLQQNFGSSRAEGIMLLAVRDRPFRNEFDFAVKTNMTQAELSKVFGKLSANAIPGGGPAAVRAKVNVNTASQVVLQCLPGLTATDASAIASYRQTNASADPSNVSWLLTVLAKEKAVAVGDYVGGRSVTYSGDILAVSGDGRAFKRVKVVVDASAGSARVIYRRDLTGFGWPLDSSLRDDLRSGRGLNGTNAASGGGTIAP